MAIVAVIYLVLLALDMLMLPFRCTLHRLPRSPAIMIADALVNAALTIPLCLRILGVL